ncbi:MAG TPA: outer membrane lipoprotein carrier protein LolA [Kofleriaceae bacterium]|nr:outer membrane lipoprotein carrier protein LolA [Kofleriaceae bacterium]
MLTTLFPIFFAWFTGATAPATAPARMVVKPAPVLQAQPVADKNSAPASPTAGAIRIAPNPADDVVKGVQDFYKKTSQLTAKFRQTNVNKTFGLPTVNDGKVYLKKPGKMRWDYFSKRDKNKVSRSQMSDGKMIWAVDVNGKWYYKQDLAKSTLPVAVTFLTGKGELSKEFNARLLTGSKHGTASDKVLELTPKKPSAQFKTLVLVVDPATFRVKKSIVTTATGDTTEFSFFEPDTTKMVADTWFVFNPSGPTTKGFREIKAEDAPQK